MNKNLIKLVVIGDGNVGKTCLMTRFSKKKFPDEYIPTVLQKTLVNIEINQTTFHLSLFDTAGQENYEHLRISTYPNTNVFLVCFSVDNQISFENVKSIWYPDIKDYCTRKPFILVGTKSDLRKSRINQNNLVDKEIAEILAKNLGAYKYLECSAKNEEGVKEILELTVSAYLKKKLIM